MDANSINAVKFNATTRIEKGKTEKKKKPAAKEPRQPRDRVDISQDKSEKSKDSRASNPQAYNDLGIVKGDLNQCSTILDSVDYSIGRTDSSVDRAESELRWAEFPIREASRDTAEKDVSSEGYRIDRYMRSAKREVDSGGSQTILADRDLDRLKQKMAGAYQKLKEVKDSLTSPENKTTAQLVDKSMQLLNGTFKTIDSGHREVGSLDREMDDAQRNLNRADMYVMDVKMDRKGKDVSHAGRQLDYIVDRTGWNLRDSDRFIRNAGTDFNNAKNQLKDTIRAVESAQQSLTKKPE